MSCPFCQLATTDNASSQEICQKLHPLNSSRVVLTTIVLAVTLLVAVHDCEWRPVFTLEGASISWHTKIHKWLHPVLHP